MKKARMSALTLSNIVLEDPPGAMWQEKEKQINEDEGSKIVCR